jgi:hypothetical protein
VFQLLCEEHEAIETDEVLEQMQVFTVTDEYTDQPDPSLPINDF